MGIDMLEDGDYAALSQSRCGNSFIDDYQYENFDSRKERNRKTETERDVVDRIWRIDEAFKDNCSYLNMRLTNLSNEINSLRQQNRGQDFANRTLNPMIEWEAKYKSEINRLKCEDNELEEKKKEEEKKIVKTFRDVTNTPPPMLPPEIEDEKSSNTNKYIIYGVGGLFLVIILVAIIKK
jgi:seryl-tRNA synthetase